jgi:hypothetical protein
MTLKPAKRGLPPGPASPAKKSEPKATAKAPELQRGMTKSTAPSKGSEKPAKQLPAVTGGENALVAPNDDVLKQIIEDGEQLSPAFGREDLAIPRIEIIQSNSDQTKRGSETYIEGAQAGMFFNTVSKELFNEVFLIPTFYQRIFNEWVPRDQGGGFRGQHLPESDAVRSAKPDAKNSRLLVLPNGNQLIETAQYFCLHVKEDGTVEPVVVSMKSTQWKVARRWNTFMRQQMIEAQGRRFQAPIFAFVYQFSTVLEKNDMGSWYSWVPLGLTPLNLGEPDGIANYQTGRMLAAGAKKGELKAAAEVTDMGEATPRDVAHTEHGDEEDSGPVDDETDQGGEEQGSDDKPGSRSAGKNRLPF